MVFLQKLEESLIGLLLVATVLLVFAEVVMRFGFGMGLLWIQELTLTLSAWFVLLGASWCLKVGGHIGVDAAVARLKGLPRRITGMIAVLAGLLYTWLIGYGSWIYLAKIHKVGLEMTDLPIALWQAHSILVLGMLLLAFRLLMLLWDIFEPLA